MDVTRISKSVIKVEIRQIKKKFWLSSDIHYDSLYNDRKRLKADLDNMLEEEAHMMDAGDIFDAMQGRFDFRSSNEDIRTEYLSDRYYDLIVDDAIEFFKPYAKNILHLGYGNHETSVIKHVGTDLLQRLAYGLSTDEHKVEVGGYRGWVQFKMYNDTVRGGINYYYYHGKGGNAPVTKGVIDTARQAAYLPDANVVHNAHNHQAYLLPIARDRISNQAKVYQDLSWYVRTPGYKAEARNRDDGLGFGHEVHAGPTPLGSAWMELYWNGNKPAVKVTPEWY